MRIYNIDNRAALEVDGGVVDVERASGGAFAPDPQALFDRWEAVCSWAAGFSGPPETALPDEQRIGSPIPRPRQVFAVGINYASHVEESGFDIPTTPLVFTKFPASVAGPYDRIALPPGAVDFEVELVVVIGRRAERVSAQDAWQHVAGLTAGQDLSERYTQWNGPAPQQMSLGKSFPGFSPVGPVLVTPDEFADPDDIEIGCSVNGTAMQKASTRDMVFGVPALIEYISGIVPLLPGDLLFTGTPGGVGFTRSPQVLLTPGDELSTYIDGIGSMRHTFTARDDVASGTEQ